MSELQELLSETLTENLNQIILSNPRNADQVSKVRVRPVLIGETLKFQETRYQGTKVFHANLSREETALNIERLLRESFRQGEIDAGERSATILVSKKGKMTVKTRRKPAAPSGTLSGTAVPAGTPATPAGPHAGTAATLPGTASAPAEISTGAPTARDRLAHNRTKHYLLPEGEPIDFLIRLGVQTPDGRITKNRYDKFRQINRYLEFIEDILEELPKDRPLKIIDFGCGKSYLTFAMYYYLHVKKGLAVTVTGLDLKQDVIGHCNALARELRYDGLSFSQGDIGSYDSEEGADMVVSLHACDTATDYALEKAVRWKAKVILAVPCCQHECNRQIRSDLLRPALQYGIIKERMAALLTDAVRAQLLEEHGYDTQVLEFIDMEHTPKNLLIRAVRRRGMGPARTAKGRREMEEALQMHPTLEKLLGDEE